MRKKRKLIRTFTGALVMFLTIAALVTVTVLIYTVVEDASGGNNAVIAGTMFAVIAAVSLISAVIDYLRRKYTVDKSLNKILDATDKIAAGDFTVRLEITRPLRRYDEFDYIMENLNKMAVELSRTEALHSDFISNVSHEMKTPLAVIQNYAILLKNKDIDGATREKYAETLSAAAKRLTALVTDILKLSKLENSEIKPEAEIINFTETLAEIVLGFEDVIAKKNLNLVCDFDEDVKVKSCQSYLEIVFNNLLSNAVKFTESGGSVSVSLKSEEGYAVVKVEDTGCGISKETGKRIFEKFYQGDTSHSQEGNGLGLALVKKVIDITGGEISVSSEAGKGTAFTVKLKEYEGV